MKAAAMVLAVGLGLLVSLPARAPAQEAADSVQTAEALRVYLDCRSRYCDFDYFRRQITFVNYVRNRQEAQVHVLITTQRTGSGGQQFTIEYIGREEFDGTNDTLVYYSSDTDTRDQVRAGLTRSLKLGLVRYVARLPLAEGLSVTYQVPDSLRGQPQAPHDPWNYWIFRVRLGSNFGGERLQRSVAGNLSLSANRTTEEWKIRLSVSGWYSEDDFQLSDSSRLKSVTRNYGGSGAVVKSLGEHWSLGGSAEARASTFRNQDLALKAGPAIEFDVFPYSESTHRMLTLAYQLAFNYFDYNQVTLFGKTTEVRASHGASVGYSVEQPWGSIDVSLEGDAFADDLKMHRVELGGRINLQLVRGLQLNIFGSFERVKDQIYLPREGATEEEVLLRLRELGTDYRYFTSISLSYTFGSIFNNIVNPRFD